MMRRLLTSLFFLLTSAVVSTAFEAVAYVPFYRIDPLPGAENALGRPGWDAAPDAWNGKIISDNRSVLPHYWYEAFTKHRLLKNYNEFLLHISIEEAFGEGRTPDSRYFSYLRGLKQQSPRASIRLSLLGHTSDFMPIAGDEELRKNFSDYLAELCIDEGIDGIDLDWEFSAAPRQREIEAITALAEELQEALPPNTILSAAVSRWRLPGKDFFAQLDRVHLMAYDGYGRHSTYEGALADAEIVLARMDIPEEKLVLGIPFYGRVFDSKSEDYFSGTKNYRDIIQEFDPPEDADEAGGYFYNGLSTVQAKTTWARENQLGGVFSWEPFYDIQGKMSLSSAIRAIADQDEPDKNEESN